MKKILLSSIIAFAFLTGNAQRSVDLSVETITEPNQFKPGQNLLFNVDFKNNGPDSMKMGDTLYFLLNFNNQISTPWFVSVLAKDVAKDSMINITTSFATTGIAITGSFTGSFCVVAALSHRNTTDTLLTESTTTQANNILCKNIQYGWYTGISYNDLNSTLQVYPNPTGSNTTVSYNLNENSNVSVKIFDMTGKVVLSENKKANAGMNSNTFDVSTLANGVYGVSISVDDNTVVRKLIIAK